MEFPTPQEQLLIPLFRAQVKDILRNEEEQSDAFLLKWIRARDLDLIKAEEMIRNSMKWRKENGIDSILQKPRDSYFREKMPFYVEHSDRQGRPVLCLHFSKWDLRQAVSDGKIDGFVQHVTILFETLLEALRKLNEDRKSTGDYPVTQAIWLLDCQDFPYSQVMSIKGVQELVKVVSMFEAHYPELLYKCYVLNSPRTIHLLFSLVKYAMPPKTVDKFQFRGTNRKEWEIEIREEIDSSKLPYQYGGNL